MYNLYIVQLYMHSLSSVKIAYHGDNGCDEYHCAHVVMFNLFEYVLYCFKCDSVDDDDKMVIWCTIAQIWCTIAPGFMGDGSKPRQRVHWAQNCCTAWISIAQITIAQNPCAQIAKQIILVTNILPLAINLTHCSNWLGYCDIKSDEKNSKKQFQSKTLKDTHQMLSGIVTHPTNQVEPSHHSTFSGNV